ncbi:putative membrane protein [Paraburkholderia sp. GAS42]|jgi:putative membrane protein
MQNTLKGCKIAVPAVDGFEQAELVEPKRALTFQHSLRVSAVAIGVAMITLGAAHAQTGEPSAAAQTKLSAADQQFVQDASQAGATEMAASKLALKNSSDPQVKQFATQMIADHSKLARNLDVVVAKKGLKAPPSADSAVVGKLQGLKGADFDQAYVADVAVSGHQKAVELFQKESESGTDQQLKAAATKALPMIQHHLAMAQQLGNAKKGAL